MTMRSRRCNPKRVRSFDERDYIDGKQGRCNYQYMH